jgi:hypothetical protein
MILFDSVPVFSSVLSLSSVAVLLGGGVAWGKLNARVTELNARVGEIERDYVQRSEFQMLQRSLDSIQLDVREIRKRVDQR